MPSRPLSQTLSFFGLLTEACSRHILTPYRKKKERKSEVYVDTLSFSPKVTIKYVNAIFVHLFVLLRIQFWTVIKKCYLQSCE